MPILCECGNTNNGMMKYLSGRQFHGRDREVLERRKQIKQKTMLLRRKQKRSFRLAEIEGKVYMNTEIISSLFAQFVQNLLTKLLKKFKFIQSMSRKGNCYDNAVTERFFHTLKKEPVFWRE